MAREDGRKGDREFGIGIKRLPYMFPGPVDEDGEEVPDIEFRPQDVDKLDGRMLVALPQHEVAQPPHAARADEDIEGRAALREEVLAHGRFVDGLDIDVAPLCLDGNLTDGRGNLVLGRVGKADI